MWPFKKKKELCGIRGDGKGAYTFELTEEEEEWVNAELSVFQGSGIHKDYYEEIKRCSLARSLVTYSSSQKSNALCADDKSRQKECFDKAIAAMTKSLSINPLPIYYYALAELFTLANRKDIAVDVYKKFLEEQSRFSPSVIEKVMLAEWDVEEAIRTATSILSSGR